MSRSKVKIRSKFHRIKFRCPCKTEHKRQNYKRKAIFFSRSNGRTNIFECFAFGAVWKSSIFPSEPHTFESHVNGKVVPLPWSRDHISPHSNPNHINFSHSRVVAFVASFVGNILKLNRSLYASSGLFNIPFSVHDLTSQHDCYVLPVCMCVYVRWMLFVCGHLCGCMCV